MNISVASALHRLNGKPLTDIPDRVKNETIPGSI
jgi:hypothetical protein